MRADCKSTRTKPERMEIREVNITKSGMHNAFRFYLSH